MVDETTSLECIENIDADSNATGSFKGKKSVFRWLIVALIVLVIGGSVFAGLWLTLPVIWPDSEGEQQEVYDPYAWINDQPDELSIYVKTSIPIRDIMTREEQAAAIPVIRNLTQVDVINFVEAIQRNGEKGHIVNQFGGRIKWHNVDSLPDDWPVNNLGSPLAMLRITTTFPKVNPSKEHIGSQNFLYDTPEPVRYYGDFSDPNVSITIIDSTQLR